MRSRRHRVVQAWAVHAYTGMGLVIGFLALEAASHGRVREAFLWMAAALFIDATDGALARGARVKEVVPSFDGGKLDDIVDYINYVLVPVYFAYSASMFPSGWCAAVAFLPLLASAYGFCQKRAKTADFFFTGFPSFWNITVYYLYTLRTPPGLNAAAVVVLSVLVFVPIGYVYPTRNPFLRRLTLALGGLWAGTLTVTILELPSPSRIVLLGSLTYPLYYVALSMYCHFVRRQDGLQLEGSVT